MSVSERRELNFSFDFTQPFRKLILIFGVALVKNSLITSMETVIFYIFLMPSEMASISLQYHLLKSLKEEPDLTLLVSLN